ncbi:DNA translocase FtsK-like [Pectinophora gossypiella]|uniref:DNA translocase FtsK-like n=1 Tax=Pectinophora gossypiella TaxID=13191 RepID=UPI00214F45BB|nr:DNA translocase FtsK-like [Pectinophora gossypiella]
MAPLLRLTILAVCCACACAQYADERAPRYIPSENKVTSTPVPILKQINRHNEDGSYTYGYEAADGSFKIETKAATGEVKGKYGYKDDTGKVRVIEYGANKYGFQPAGEGITVAPPTLVDETTRDQEGSRPGKGQANRNQYRAQPAQQAVDYDYEEPAPAPRPRPVPRPQPQPQPQYRPAPPQPQQQYRPAPQSAPTPPKPAFFAGAAPAPLDQEQFFSPAPAQPRQQQYRPKQDFRPAPAIQYSQNYNNPAPQQNFAPAPAEPRYSAPQFNQQPFSQPRNQQPFSQPRNQQPFSMLDQLLKEYALPQGGAAPLHDITFGSY